MSITVVNPATGKPGRTYEPTSDAAVGDAIARAHSTFATFRATSFAERAERMRALGKLLRDRAPELARLMAEEMGKPVRDGRAEAEKCATTCDFYATHAERFLATETRDIDGQRGLVAFRPLGVVLAVMPWNFPLWQVIRFAAPALMAGNTALLKHASNVPGCSRALEALTLDAGFPAGAFTSLLIASDRVAGILADPRVRAATLTGSGAAGKSLAKAAGESLKKTVLELGGSDAYVVLEDADVELAATLCAKSRLLNAGQSCIAAKRFIVVEAVREAFTTRFVEAMRAVTMGDPLDEATTMGPLARADLRDEVHAQVKRTVEKGARCVLGGELPTGAFAAGAYYPPTVLTGVARGMPAFDDEVFGPVAAVIAAKDEDEAIALANDSPFGLGAAVFTRDRARGERIAVERIDAGACFVNDFVRSDPRLPFGGIKESGYGRELDAFGIREFVNVKSVLLGRT